MRRAFSDWLCWLIVAVAIVVTCAKVHGAEISVRGFGAKGDGRTDDTAAIQAAFDSGVGKSAVVFPQGDYLVSKPLVSLTADRYVIRGDRAALLYTGDSGACLTYGAPAGKTRWWGSVTGLRILQQKVDWGKPTRGLVIQNVQYGGCNIDQIYGFRDGFVPRGDNEGCVFNSFHIGLTTDCKTLWKIEVVGSSGYCNRNRMYDSPVTARGVTGVAPYDAATLLDVSGRVDSWIFDNCTFAGPASKATLLRCGKTSMVFRDCGFETSGSVGQMPITGQSDALVRVIRPVGVNYVAWPTWAKVEQ